MIVEVYCSKCRTIINEGCEKEIDLSELDNEENFMKLAAKFGFARIGKSDKVKIVVDEKSDNLRELYSVIRRKGKSRFENVADETVEIAEVDFEDFKEALIERIKSKAKKFRVSGNKIIIKGHKSKFEEEQDEDGNVIEQRWVCPVCGNLLCRIVYGERL